ncbi:MAG TPA: hypothetical protein VJ761_00100 [Ktedonobacteraceae bacterium]|nr:hypothetical protein [Ktedonobacteraceae bacterium]
MHRQAVLQHTDQTVREHRSPPARLVVSVDRQLGVVGERVEVLPSLYGMVVMSYEKGCQVWLCSVDVQAWSACKRE